MNPQRLFAQICARHGLNAAELDEYVPLVARAVISPPDVRTRILTLVEDSLSRRAGGDPDATFDALEADLDDEVLRAVATRLHDWTPESGERPQF